MKKLAALLLAVLCSCAPAPTVVEPDIVEPECAGQGYCELLPDIDGDNLCKPDLGECVLVGCTDAFCESYLLDGRCVAGEDRGGQCCGVGGCCAFDDVACLTGKS